ncbi:MAG: GNAT family N-acetyltransferase [Actinomycetota bacterium]|nr:GNAT family N-acetyltransferase [Actinomycetota bacterium]
MPVLVPPVVSAGAMSQRVLPTLGVDELVIRPWREDDAAAVAHAYLDPDVRRWHVRSMDEDEALVWIKSRRERWSREVGVDWAITGDGVIVGRIGVRTMNLDEGSAEPAYWVVPDARGRLIASRAIVAMTTWLFGEIGMHPLDLYHSVDNGPSCRVAGKADFPWEATLRQQVLHADGWHDMHLHARIA